MDLVFFSAVAPKQFPRGETTELTVVMYEEEYRGILDQIRENYNSAVITRSSGALEVAQRTKIRIVMHTEDADVHFLNTEESGTWMGKYLEFSFWMEVPENYAKNQIRLSALVYANDVPLTTLRFLVKCVSDSVQQITPQRKDIRTAFISYARQDIAKVTLLIQAIEKVRPDLKLFFDLEDLHSGDHWQEVLKKELDQRDMLFLCWSTSAMQSKWVDFEWRYMYDRRGIHYIDPFPLESPQNCPPPQELMQLHFDDRWLRYRSQKEPRKEGVFYVRDCESNAVFPVTKASVVIGKGQGVDIRFSSHVISRYHARIEAMHDGTFLVQDLNSTYGTFLDSTEVRITESGCTVMPGTRIRLANQTIEIM